MEHQNHHPSDHDLVLAFDGELPDHRQAAVATHLADCAPCRCRRGEIARVTTMVTTLHGSTPGDSEQSASRERLRMQLAELTSQAQSSSGIPIRLVFELPRWISTAAAVAALVLLAGVVYRLAPIGRAVSGVDPGALPIASLTPGATWNITTADLCAPHPQEQRPVADAVRQQVLRGYGMSHVPAVEYELDYLITPELGGAPAAENLWPQRYASRTWNAHVKDQLEQLLPRLVCDGVVSLETAQREIAGDWVDAYKRYFRTNVPLLAHARLAAQLSVGAREDDDLTYPVWRSSRAGALQMIALSAAR
jgi:hypothetical protein